PTRPAPPPPSPAGGGRCRGPPENTPRLRAVLDCPGLGGAVPRAGAAVRPAGDGAPLRSTAPPSAPLGSGLLPGQPTPLPAGPGGQPSLPAGSENGAVDTPPRSH